MRRDFALQPPNLALVELVEWLDNHRLIGTPQYVEHLCRNPDIMTPKGGEFVPPKNISDIEGLFISEPTHWSFVDGMEVQLDMGEYTVFWGIDDVDPLFPIHDTCIDLAKRVIQTRNDRLLTPTSRATLMTLYESLSKEWTRGWKLITSQPALVQGAYMRYDVHGEYGLEWEHKYFGARDRQEHHGWNVARGDEWFCADPTNIPELRDFVLNLLPQAPIPSGLPDFKTLQLSSETFTSTEEKYGLEALPKEILDEIACHLTVSSVFALRSSSKTLAACLYPDQRFFFQRLLGGTLIPHIWELESQECVDKNGEDVSLKGTLQLGDEARWDWKALAKLLANKDAIMIAEEGKLLDAPIGFRNRCRIWKIIEAALDSIQFEATRNSGEFTLDELEDHSFYVEMSEDSVAHRYKNHWLLRKPAAKAFAKGDIVLVERIFYSIGGRPPVVRSESAERFLNWRCHLVDHSESGIDAPSSELIDIHNCFAEAFKWSEISEIITWQKFTSQPIRRVERRHSYLEPLKSAILALRLKVPNTMHAWKYNALGFLGLHLYGYTSSCAQRLPCRILCWLAYHLHDFDAADAADAGAGAGAGADAGADAHVDADVDAAAADASDQAV
ncbi:uncharacterized protein BP5553_02523 [Venustampulla echinocandica]|uniref:F-box domain-containing protein n=1 Tax=Venustampulla echinocandica TaxID=2656787 RepID=A0A370U441_9HELO|nr:uncharacterized protein BP5553_02523 [Venustampulla echinocandica]RDL42544.1 hypothetical protein BP5553_02523 [Venustampulla echinocandica]